MSKVIKDTKTEIIKAFKSIGWDLKPHGHGFYNFVKPNGKEISLQMWFPQDEERPCRVEIDFNDYNGAISFNWPEVYFEYMPMKKGLRRDTISLMVKGVKNGHVFINFANFDINP